MDNKEANVTINFVTGMFNVKGKSFSEWIDGEFEKLKSFLDTERTDVSGVTPPNDALRAGDVIVPEDVGKVEAKNEVKDEIQELWLFFDKLRNAIKIIETSVEDLSLLRETKNCELIDDNYTQLENRIKQIDKNYDSRLSLYQEIIEKLINQKKTTLTTDLNNKISSSKQVIGSFKVEVQMSTPRQNIM